MRTGQNVLSFQKCPHIASILVLSMLQVQEHTLTHSEEKRLVMEGTNQPVLDSRPQLLTFRMDKGEMLITCTHSQRLCL